ncbi:hypothetical protein [Methanobrevibacter sp. DSM 116169]|uniref:hypothetical protein n=1 Tax=Methanobrevibacter sp. DSM 116169 TaxID=3242727 RepID=UPI0038FC7148
MLEMKEYYQILMYLDVYRVDRHYPCQDYFRELSDDEINPDYLISDDLLFKTNYRDYKGINSVEVVLSADAPFSSNDLQFCFSEYLEGYVPVMVLDAYNDDSFNADTIVKVVFKVADKDYQMADSTRVLTNIQTVQLKHDIQNIVFDVKDIIFKTHEPKHSLEALEENIEKGIDHVLRKLQSNIKKVPEELSHLPYKSGAGYRWLQIWDLEGYKHNDDQKNAKSYGVRLLTEVDEAIQLYKETNDLDTENDVKMNMIDSSTMTWWQNECIRKKS